MHLAPTSLWTPSSPTPNTHRPGPVVGKGGDFEMTSQEVGNLEVRSGSSRFHRKYDFRSGKIM